MNQIQITCNQAGKILAINTRDKTFLGFCPTELIHKKRIFHFFPPSAVLHYIRKWQALCTTDQKQSATFAFQAKTGTLHTVELNIQPTQNTLTCTLKLLSDLSPQSLLPPKTLGHWFEKWFIITRFKFALGSIVPLSIGIAYCIYLKGFNAIPIDLLFLVIIGCALLHFTTNTFNDYFDWKSGADQDNTDYVLFISGGSRVLDFKIASEKTLLWFSIIGFFVIACIGAYLTYRQGLLILLFGGIGAFCVYFYTAPPIRLASRSGLGELAHIICLGPLMIAGTRFALLGHCAYSDLLIGLPFGLLITASLLGNEYPDFKSDQRVGKNNFMVLLGEDRFYLGLIPLIIIPFLLLLIGFVSQIYPKYTLLSFLSFPVAIQLIKTSLQLKQYPDLMGKLCDKLFVLYFSFSLLFLVGILVS